MVDGIPEAHQQVQPPFAFGGIRSIGGDMIEKVVDRSAKQGKGGHGARPQSTVDPIVPIMTLIDSSPGRRKLKRGLPEAMNWGSSVRT